MGIRINTNIAALKAQRSLGTSVSALQRALERLSSGSRINKAGDDAAGLAVSEGLISQVRGLRQAIRNANDGVGFLSTAEAALAQSTAITQRIRELAIEAATGSISGSGRTNLNNEAQALIAEFDQIAKTTNFNGVYLLDGTFQTSTLQVGNSSGETISFSIGDARAATLGSQAIQSGSQNGITAPTNGLVVNGIPINNSTNDGVSTAQKSYSALAIANAINAAQGQTAVRADVLATTVRIQNLDFSSFNGTIYSGEFSINGVSVTGSVPNINSLISAINANSTSTGVTASLYPNSTTDILLTASDGRNIQIATASTANGAAIASTNFWTVLEDTNNFAGADTLYSVAQSSFSAGGATRVLSGGVQLRSSSAITLSGSNVSQSVGFSTTAIAVGNTTQLSSVKIDSVSGAVSALSTISVVIDQLATLRASMGAVQNRLDASSTVLALNVENLSAANSQIRDADLAVETAEFTKAQILQQAGVSVLSQANTSSKAALQLLQFNQ